MLSVLKALIILRLCFPVCLTRAWWVSSHVSLCRSARSFSPATRRSLVTTQLAERKRHYISSLANPATKVAIVSRIVPITKEWNVTVWEWETPAPLVEDYWSSHEEQLQQQSHSQKKQLLKEANEDLLDPFGLITWPGAVVAAHELLQHNQFLRNATVLVLGSGVGLEVQVAAQLGAARVYALDVHPTTLQLLQYGIPSHLSHVVKPIVFDLCDRQTPLPFLQTVSLTIVADVLYNPQLAEEVARRCRESYNHGSDVLITDSQRLVHDFIEMISPLDTGSQCNNTSTPLAWEERRLNDFTGSGILVEEDQTYNVSARVLWMKHPKGTQVKQCK
jgi:predicted nicotinamide N-methyase